MAILGDQARRIYITSINISGVVIRANAVSPTYPVVFPSAVPIVKLTTPMKHHNLIIIRYLFILILSMNVILLFVKAVLQFLQTIVSA